MINYVEIRRILSKDGGKGYGSFNRRIEKFRTIRVTAYIYLVPGVPYPSYHIGGWSRKILKSMSVNNEIDYKNTSFNWINFCYSAFIALVSIFPLLGMLGTVLALLSLDITGGATQELKANFFLALDTTAWGLVFSIAFKIANSFFQTTIESAIEKIDILVKATTPKREAAENEETTDNPRLHFSA